MTQEFRQNRPQGLLGNLASESRSQRGFTLIEMLIVVAIIGLVASLVGPSLIRRLQGAQRDTAKAQLKGMSMALDMYKLDMKRYPDSLEGLVKSTGSKWNGPYLRDVTDVPKDPWDEPYIYSPKDGGRNYALSCRCDGEELRYK